MNTYKPNKFDGYCGCGTKVLAGAGFYIYGQTFCQTPNDLTRCPTEQETLNKLVTANEAHTNAIWESSFTPTPDGACDKCGGNGKYVFSNGTIGVCYQCNGTGKDK